MQFLDWIVPGLLAAVAMAGSGFLWMRSPSRSRIRRARQFLDKHTNYRVTSLLGMGREGIVFEVMDHSAGEGQAQLRALKILDTRDGRGFPHRIRLKEAMDAAVAELGLEAWPCLPHVYDLSILEGDGHAIPVEVMERVDGHNLTEAIAKGRLVDWRLPDRLQALDELLEGLAALSSKGLNFVHIDPDNLMVTPDQRLMLIDLSGFRLVAMTTRRRRRFFRRFARTFDALVHDHRDEILRGGHGPGGARFLHQLGFYRDLPKGERPPREQELYSIDELRNLLREAFSRSS